MIPQSMDGPVGDIHQPLHAADHEDQGGNQVKVLFGNRTVGSALHSFWDTEVVKRNGSDPATVARSLDQVQEIGRAHV